MAEQAYAYVTLIPVAKGFQREVAKQLDGVGGPSGAAGKAAGKSFGDGFGAALKGGAQIAAGVAAFGAAAVAAMIPALNAASTFYAEFEGVNQIFGDAAAGVQDFANSAAKNLGLSETAALNASKNFGIFATSAGLSGQAAADFSTDLVAAAADLGSFNDVPVEQALAAITSGLQGSSEPLRQFGIFLDDATVKAYAMEQGMGDVYDDMTANEKTVLRQAALLEQMGVQAGDFENYADTYGNAIKTIQATFTDLNTEIGLALMPSIEALVITFRDSLSQIQDPTTDLGIAWAELIGTFEAFGETFASVFGQIDAAAVLTGVLQVVQMIVNGFSQLIYIGGDLGDILGRIFSGDFAGAGQQASTFFDRYNTFVDGLYASADAAVRRAQAPVVSSAENIRFDRLDPRTSLTGLTGTTRTGATGTSQDMTAQAEKLIKDTRKAFNARREEFRAEVRDIQRDYALDQLDIAKDYEDNVAAATKRFNDASVEITKRYNDQVSQANKKRDESLADALKEHNGRISQIQDEFAKRQADIIQQSMDRLRSAYQSAVEINVASIFDSEAIAGSIDGTIEMMRKKLIDSRQLMANAAALSAAGFSQTFIEQVVSAGTDVGNEMATAILNSSPEQQAEMQMLFSEIETEASSGMDDLSKTIYEKNGLATEALKDLYAQTEQELIDSIERQNAAYQETMAAIQEEFNESLAAAEVMRSEAMQQAQDALDEAILEAKIKRDEALQEAEEQLQEALLKANEDFNKDLERIQEAFEEKIASMKGKIRGLTSEIADLVGQVGRAESQAASRISGLQGRLTELQLVPFAKGGLVTGPTAALIGEAGPEVVIPLDRFESMMGGGQQAVNYYAAPNQSLDSEQELFQAMKRAKVVVGW